MDFQKLETNATAMKTEAEALVGALSTNPYHKTTFDSLMVSITMLSDFLNDAQNVKALSDYDKKPDATKDNCPLDILCKDLLEKLGAIEPLLVTGVFDFMRPENQPTTNEHGQQIMPSVQYDESAFHELTQVLNELFSSNLLLALEALKYLSGHNKTLIILGANGSGKTSFANYLKSVEMHVKVIPASKPIKAIGYISDIYNSTVGAYNDEIYQGGDLRGLALIICCQL